MIARNYTLPRNYYGVSVIGYREVIRLVVIWFDQLGFWGVRYNGLAEKLGMKIFK